MSKERRRGNVLSMTEEQREKAREKIMGRWRSGESIIQIPGDRNG